MSIDAVVDASLAELGGVLHAIDPAAIEAALAMIADAGAIMLYGCGREGFQMRGFAQRLYHLGRNATMQGDVAAPPLGPGDLFIASAGPGQLSTVTALCATARAAGARVLLLTAEPGMAPPADAVLTIPAQTMARDRAAGASGLPMGSLYEGALFVLFEAMVLALRDRVAETPETMRARHTNME